MWGVIFLFKLNGKEGDCMADIKKKTSISKAKDKINKPKTSNNISNVKHEALKTAGELMHGKNLQQRSSQTDESPENYAEEQIEDRAERAASAAADVSGQSVRYIKNKVNQYHAKNSINTQKNPVSENYVKEVGLEYTDAPKTPNVYNEKKEAVQIKDGIKNKQTKSIIKSKENLQGMQRDVPKIKNRENMIAEQSKISDSPNIKTKNINANKMNAFLKNRENAITEQLKISDDLRIKTKDKNANKMNAFSDNRLKIKSKEEYLQTRKYRLKSEKVYRSKKNIVRPKTLKEVNLRQLELSIANDKDKAVKRYVQSNIKTKAETQKLLNGTYKSPKENLIQETHMINDSYAHPKQRPDIVEKIKVKRADIKTKENYINAHKKFELSNNFIQSKTNSNDKNIIKKRFQPIIKSDKKGTSILNKKNKTLSAGINKSKVNYYSKVISRAEKQIKTGAEKLVKARVAKQAVNKSKRMVQSSVQNIKRAVKASVKIAKAVKLAVTKTAKAVVSAIAALGGGMAVLIAVTVVVIIAAIAASPFGIFISNEVSDEGTAVVKNAGSLVGKVNYFWGGKSMVKGWDSSWGTMRTVTAAGSPTTGTIRTFGLDCSGFVTWVFNNSGMGYSVGHGTYGQKAASRLISRSEIQAGDLAFLADYSHVGIIAGKNDSGSILVIHCSSSANNVTVATVESVGFTVFRRPNCL